MKEFHQTTYKPFFRPLYVVQMIKVVVIRAIYGSSSPIPSSRAAITGAGAQRLSLLRFSFQFQLFMMNDDQEVVLVEGEGRRSLVSFGRRARWRILQQSGNKETKRFLHAIFMKIVGIVIVQRSEMSQCSVSVILTSSGLRTLGA